MLFVKIHYDEIQRKVKDFIKSDKFVVINENDTELYGYYSVKVIDTDLKPANTIFELSKISNYRIYSLIKIISESFPYNCFHTTFTIVMNYYSLLSIMSYKYGKKHKLDDMLDTYITYFNNECEKLKYDNTVLKKISSSVNYNSADISEIYVDDAIELLKSNILMCSKIKKRKKYNHFYRCNIYKYLKYLKRKICLFDNYDYAMILLENGKRSIYNIDKLKNIIIKLMLFSQNGITYFKISVYDLIEIIKSMNLEHKLFNYCNDFGVINIYDMIKFKYSESRENNMINLFVDTFKENSELVVTYFREMFEHVEFSNLKILNLIGDDNPKDLTKLWFYKLINEIFYNQTTYITKNLLNYIKLNDNNKCYNMKKFIIFYSEHNIRLFNGCRKIDFTQLESEFFKISIDEILKFNRYIIRYSNEEINHPEVINVKINDNPAFNDFVLHNVVKYKRALIHYLFNYQPKYTNLKQLMY